VKILRRQAAPSITTAKLIISSSQWDVARVHQTNDPSVRGLLKKSLHPQTTNVSLAEIIVPAADLSEQISTAGMEASAHAT